jgi:hypothetical protein
MSRSAMMPKTSNQRRLFRILPLAAVAVVLVIIGGPGKLAQLPTLARWGLFACLVFAFFEPLVPGSRFGGRSVLAPQSLARNRYARTFWKVLLILYICCLVAEMMGVAWFYGKVPLKYSSYPSGCYGCAHRSCLENLEIASRSFSPQRSDTGKAAQLLKYRDRVHNAESLATGRMGGQLEVGRKRAL